MDYEFNNMLIYTTHGIDWDINNVQEVNHEDYCLKVTYYDDIIRETMVLTVFKSNIIGYEYAKEMESKYGGEI